MTAAPILVVEDEFIIAELIKDTLEMAGYGECRHAASVPDALDAIDGAQWRGALLDIRLNGALVFPVAEALLKRGVPFAFSSGGADERDVPAAFLNVPVLRKPWSVGDLESLAARLFGPT